MLRLLAPRLSRRNTLALVGSSLPVSDRFLNPVDRQSEVNPQPAGLPSSTLARDTRYEPGLTSHQQATGGLHPVHLPTSGASALENPSGALLARHKSGIVLGEGSRDAYFEHPSIALNGNPAESYLERPSSEVVDFENTQTAYVGRPASDLMLGLAVFKMCSFRSFVDNADVVLATMNRCFGNDLVTWAVRQTFFTHFCGGIEQASQLDSVFDRLHRAGIGTILFYSAELESTSHMTKQEAEKLFLENAQELIGSIHAASKAPGARFAAIKLTAMTDHNLLTKLTEAFINKGRNLKELEATVDAIRSGEPGDGHLNLEDVEQLDALYTKVQEIGRTASELGVKVFIDAEQTWIQPGIDYVALKAQRQFNTSGVVFMNTYQCYLKNSHGWLNDDLETARSNNFIFGGKLVRGAYIQAEKKRADKMGLESPIHNEKLHTDENYDRCVENILESMASGTSAEMVVASHNCTSVEKAVGKMSALGLGSNAPVYFAQLYGMADFLTYSLGRKGYKAMKLLSYGPIQKVLPFLIRRAQENSSVLGGVGTDINFMKRELFRRATGISFVQQR
ncbi:hypothetical protein BSKO_03824 [Bryopsis sp. KO-2023]|nr:hypothetical protein BSKO_03824 [Bryopsis sp. KO-2023]